MRASIIICFLSILALAGHAQTQKIGHADFEYIFSQMPEAKVIDNELKTHGTQLDNQLKAKYSEYQTKLTAYNALTSATPEAVKKDKENELVQLQESIRTFQQEAQNSIQKKNTDLMAPIYAKVSKAIEAVAKENGYSYIFTPQVVGGGDVILYNDEQFDISALVLKKLGITPVAPTTTTTAVPVKKP